MHFDLTDDERALQRGIRELCEGRFGLDRVREGFDRAMFAELGDAGVFSLRLPEPGGLGLGMTEAVVVFEELGRALVPGPLVATHLAAATVDGAASGTTVVGLVEAGRRPLLVEHADDLDVLVVVHADRVERCAIDAGREGRPLDPATGVRRLPAPPAGETIAVDVVRWTLEGGALTAALQLGIASALTTAAVAYAKEREQFGRPIGSFQAVKHICADMLVREEVARAAVYAAGVTLDGSGTAVHAGGATRTTGDDDGRTPGDAERAVAVAKLEADEAAFRNGKACVQVHGGMGFTWEVDVHRYLKRAVVQRTHFGTPEGHAETMAAAIGGAR